MLDLLGSVEAAELPSGRYVVFAHGPLDERVAGAFGDVLLPLAAAEDGAVVLDLDDAFGIDESIISVVARAAHLVCRDGERLAIITRSRTVREQLEECGLADIVTLHATLRDAVQLD